MDLHLNLKDCYFRQILSGEKKEEYREYNDYWKKRLIGRKYQRVIVKSGYPKKDDTLKQIAKPYRGYVVKDIFHEHFDGGKCVKVFAIDVS
jgi:ABC-type metal ion transport system substrate-binding protein